MSKNVKSYLPAVLILFLLTAGLRFNLLDVPLERDEGEYAYAAQVIMQGMVPYVHVYSLKLPGVFLAYAGIMTFLGDSAHGIHLGLIFLSSFTTIIIFAVGRKLYGIAGGFFAGAAYAVLSIGQAVMGVFAHSEHFVAAAAAVGFWLLTLRNSLGNLFLSGLAFGIGFLCKQHGAAFLFFSAFMILLVGPKPRRENLQEILLRLFSHLLGWAAPYLLTCLWFFQIGAFDRFWFWTVEYAQAYVSVVSLAQGWELFKDSAAQIIGDAPLIWTFFAWGVVGLLWDLTLRHARSWLLMFMAAGLLALLPGFYFREHYFIFLFPPAALIFGAGLSSLYRVGVRLFHRRQAAVCVSYALAAFCIGHSVYAQRDFLFFMTPPEASRATYGLNPFPESVEISRYLEEHTNPGDSIAVFGSEPQIYFYSKRRAATGFIYMYPMMEGHPFALQMQKDFLLEIEAAAPKYLVYVNVPTSWLRSPESPDLIFQWLQNHQTGFKLAGLTEIHPSGTRHSWAPSARWPPTSAEWVAVLKRIDG